MKVPLIIGLAALVASAAHASDQPSVTLAPTTLRLDSLGTINSLELRPAPLRMEPITVADDKPKNAQIWLLGSVSYEKFKDDKSGDEFGFIGLKGPAYQRNIYPKGRLMSGVAYSYGVGLFAAGGSVYYHVGSEKSVDFRIGVTLDVFYLGSFFGLDSVIFPYPFLGIGIKI